MKKREFVTRIRDSRGALLRSLPATILGREQAAEGGCGVIGMASSVAIPGRHLLQSLRQMRNRGNGKGGGAALVGLDPGQLGVSRKALQEDFLLTVAYLEDSARQEVERTCIVPAFEIDHVHAFPLEVPAGLEPRPPRVMGYFVRVKEAALDDFAEEVGMVEASRRALEEEFVYQNTYRLNSKFYASLGEQEAFVLSHGKDMLAFKAVAFGDDVIETYGLDDLLAHVWIGHHRYPTKGRVWHPGGAHPFVGMQEALVHNGDFANYASVCSYLAQHNIEPLFLTDTEVSVLVFDLFHRTFDYPLEYVIEGLAPTTERDFAQLPREKQRTYRMLQTAHMHGSPDGPWFFLIAQSGLGEGSERVPRLLGITDTSMLRPQVFALQQGEPGQPSIGFAASEKQAIDAALESLSAEDDRFWTRPDKLWVARGGSHTDGGAFLFSVERPQGAEPRLVCTDKFERKIKVENGTKPLRPFAVVGEEDPAVALEGRAPAAIFEEVADRLPDWSYGQFRGFLRGLENFADESDNGRESALELLATLMDRRYPAGALRRSSLLSLLDESLHRVVDSVHSGPSDGFVVWRHGEALPQSGGGRRRVIIDGRGFRPEGEGSLSRALVAAAEAGFRWITVVRARGHRFLANGFGEGSTGIRVEIFGSAGDYLASGIDGAGVVVHNNGQDQLAQIMQSGKLVVHGDVGQTFMYAAEGGEAFVLGSAAGRPLINGVGSPRVVINGTCLDYLAESFMAGDPLNGGGFAVLNGMEYGDDGVLRALDTPYPGGNLFSLASGGAIYLRDPHQQVGPDQLNGGALVSLTPEHWAQVEPMLVENERLFGIRLRRLLTVDGQRRSPEEVYRVVVPVREKALMPEEAWVAHE